MGWFLFYAPKILMQKCVCITVMALRGACAGMQLGVLQEFCLTEVLE